MNQEFSESKSPEDSEDNKSQTDEEYYSVEE
jgi:hypothetical protein